MSWCWCWWTCATRRALSFLCFPGRVWLGWAVSYTILSLPSPFPHLHSFALNLLNFTSFVANSLFGLLFPIATPSLPLSLLRKISFSLTPPSLSLPSHSASLSRSHPKTNSLVPSPFPTSQASPRHDPMTIESSSPCSIILRILRIWRKP